MKTTLSFGLMVAAASFSFACSDEGGETRGNGGTGVAQGGTGNTGTGGTGTTTQGGSTSGGGMGGSAGSMRNYGDALTITAVSTEEATISGTAAGTEIDGNAYVVASPMNPSAVPAFRDGALCMTGATAQVTGTPPDYTNLWGAEIDFDLLRGPITAAAVIGDAGVDAGGDGGPAVDTEAKPWDPGNILGFSFKIEGMTVAPALSVKAAPSGSNTSTDNFCYRPAVPPTSGQVIDVLFTDVRRDCWASPPETASLFQDPAGYSTIDNFGWQINASEMVAYMFDFCISEIRPIVP